MSDRTETAGSKTDGLVDRIMRRLGTRFSEPGRGNPRGSGVDSSTPTAPPASPDELYRQDWDALARADALTAILSLEPGAPTNEAAFDAAGRGDADRLRRFVSAESVVLSVGCGIGRVEKHLARHCRRLCAIDVSDEMIARARQWTAGVSNVEFFRTSATDLSLFPDDTFDFAYSLLVLQHLEYEDAFLALREIARVLKPGAPALVQFPKLTSPVYAAAFAQQATSRDRSSARMRFYTRDLAEQILSLAGLTIVEIALRAHGAEDPNELELVVRRAAERGKPGGQVASPPGAATPESGPESTGRYE